MRILFIQTFRKQKRLRVPRSEHCGYYLGCTSSRTRRIYPSLFSGFPDLKNTLPEAMVSPTDVDKLRARIRFEGTHIIPHSKFVDLWHLVNSVHDLKWQFTETWRTLWRRLQILLFPEYSGRRIITLCLQVGNSVDVSSVLMGFSVLT